MIGFPLCPVCEAEYRDPLNRRFHAQPNACPVCGPRLELWDVDGRSLEFDYNALQAVAKAVTFGQIAAVKGLGGFHLIVDARNEEAVRELRRRKRAKRSPSPSCTES